MRMNVRGYRENDTDVDDTVNDGEKEDGMKAG
jgi:hypothetical protein